MILLDGQTLSQKILSNLIVPPAAHLHVILVGHHPASEKYVALKEKKCHEIGLDCTVHRFDDDISSTELLSLVSQLNTDPAVTGFFIQLPLPSGLDQLKIVSSIDPKKDVDGLNPLSKNPPAVVKGIISLLDNYHLSFENRRVVIINDSHLIGQPLKTVFESRHAQVELLNDQTVDLKAHTLSADLLISATGVKNLVTADMVKDSAVVVDAASGDVDFPGVSSKSSYITPTFGGVGPMTIASLLQSVVQLAHSSIR